MAARASARSWSISPPGRAQKKQKAPKKRNSGYIQRGATGGPLEFSRRLQKKEKVAKKKGKKGKGDEAA
jgi:hypothetical protein